MHGVGWLMKIMEDKDREWDTLILIFMRKNREVCYFVEIHIALVGIMN